MTEIDFIQPKKVVGKLISIEVLDKIRTEIEMMKLGESVNVCIKAHDDAINRVLKIIDKYRTESEVEE